MSLTRTMIARAVAKNSAATRRTYTLREAVAIAEAQGVLPTTPSSPCTHASSIAVTSMFATAPFIGCDPLRGAFQSVLSDPLRAAEVSSAQGLFLRSSSQVRLEGTVQTVDHATQRHDTSVDDGVSAPYDVSLHLSVPMQSSATAGDGSKDAGNAAPSDSAVVVVQGCVLAAAVLACGASSLEETSSPQNAVELELLETLKARLEGKRVLVSGTLRLDSACGCRVTVPGEDMLSALCLLDDPTA